MLRSSFAFGRPLATRLFASAPAPSYPKYAASLNSSDRVYTQDFSEDFAKKFAHLSKLYTIKRATIEDLPLVMDLSKDFYANEPLAKVLGSTMENSWKVLEYVHSLSLTCSSRVSCILYHKDSKTPVGFRGGYYANRNAADYHLPLPELNDFERSLMRPLDFLTDQFWDMFPHVNKCLKGEMIWIAEKSRAPGLAEIFFQYGFDQERLIKNGGVRFFLLVSSANQTKKMMSRAGFMQLARGPPFVTNANRKQLLLPHGPITLLVKDMTKGIRELNVEPHWKKMGLPTWEE